MNRPSVTCYGDFTTRYGELTGQIPTGRVDVRSGLRLGFQERRVVTPGRPDTWEVQVFGFAEGSAALPSGVPGDLEAWIGLNGSGAETYTFTSAKEAGAFPWTYAKVRAAQAARVAVKSNPITGTIAGIARHLPWVGDDIEQALEGGKPPPRSSWNLEAGPTGGFQGRLDLPGLELRGSARGMHLAGVTRATNGDTTYSLKDYGESTGSIILDLAEIMPRKVRDTFNGKIDDGIVELEKLAGKLHGKPIEFPARIRQEIRRNWAGLGGTVEIRGTLNYQFTTDRNGNAKTLSKSEDTQYNLSLRTDLGAGAGRSGVEAATNVPVLGRRVVEHSALDLTDRQNRDIAREFFSGAAAASLVSPLGLITAEAVAGDAMDSVFRSRGTATRQTYDSRLGNLTGEVTAGGKRGGLIELDLESEPSTLDSAEIWEPEKGWAPWAGCRR